MESFISWAPGIKFSWPITRIKTTPQLKMEVSAIYCVAPSPSLSKTPFIQVLIPNDFSLNNYNR